MWHHPDSLHGWTNEVNIPTDGTVGVVFPEHAKARAYVNNEEVPIHSFPVKTGDKVKFKIKSHKSSVPSTVRVTYNGASHDLNVIPLEGDASSYEAPASKIAEKSKSHKSKGSKMDMSGLNLFTQPASGIGAGAGAGLGAGVVGGLLGGLLFNRNGLNGDGVGNYVTATQLQTGLDAVTTNSQNTAILNALGDIKGSIPFNEAQVQLAVAGAVADITSNNNNQTLTLMQGQAAINKNVSDTTAQIISSENATQDVVQNAAAAINLGIANLATSNLQNTYALNTAIRDDGDKTRALIISQNDAMLNRQLAVAEAALLEQRAIGRSRDVEVNVTQQVTQNQMQMQAQQQQQQQLILLSQIATGLANVTQIAHATNSNVIAGNTGAVTTGTQTANPVNVNA